MSAADALVERLPLVTLVVGKGGVGKTTCAAALAVRSGERIGPTLLLSTDPARALPSVLAQPVESQPTPVKRANRLTAQILDAGGLRSRFLARWGATLRTILDRGTYLDAADIGPLVDTALPGSDEIFSALAIAELLVNGGHQSLERRLIVDTAPTGHTLRLLNLPRTFRALVRLLEAMQEKHRFMVRTLMRTYRADDADAFLHELDTLVSALEATLRDASRCLAVMVTNPQPLVQQETARYLEALHGLRVQVGAVIWNAVDGEMPQILAGDAQQYVVPRLDRWPVGLEGLREWLGAIRLISRPRRPAASGGARRAAGRRRARKRAAGDTARPPGSARAQPTEGRERIAALLRPLTIVAGKGGVGKTTVACAIALHAVDDQHWRTLIVSTDPAPSLADAFAQPIPDRDTPVEGGGGGRMISRRARWTRPRPSSACAPSMSRVSTLSSMH